MPLAPDLVAGLVANGLSIVALVLWARVLERSFSRSTARHGLALLAFSPSAFVLSMGYSEPLFLLVGALFFMSTEGGRARPLMAVLAHATRLTGSALGAATLPRLWRSRGRDVAAWLTLAVPVVVFAAWWAAIAVLTGNPGGYLEGSPSWLTGPAGGPPSFLVAAQSGVGWLVPLAISAGTVGLFVAGTLMLIHWRRWELACYTAALLIPALALGNWEAWPRYCLGAVPRAAGITTVLTTRHRRLVLAGSMGAEAIYAFYVLGAHFALDRARVSRSPCYRQRQS
jgi:hypothetical protein